MVCEGGKETIASNLNFIFSLSKQSGIELQTITFGRNISVTTSLVNSKHLSIAGWISGIRYNCRILLLPK